MITELWKSRDRFPFFSRRWLKSWLKRLHQSPQLVNQAWQQRRLLLGGARIHPSAFFSESRLATGNRHFLEVGAYTFIGRVQIALHANVTIGQRVCINDGVKILTASHDIRRPDWPSTARPIVIEDYAWIATDAMILPGVTIGRGAVVAAGAVVSRDLPPGAVAAGNPAQIKLGQRCENLDYHPTASLALFTAWRSLQKTSPPASKNHE